MGYFYAAQGGYV